MAKNIKKRSASHIYFGVNKQTGELMHISEVPSGQKCDCICAACGEPFEARKGSIRRHHFAHVSNYECMYASEVAIYKAVADRLEKEKCITIPDVTLSFPAWSQTELLQEKRELIFDEVNYTCEELSYPPTLKIQAQGSFLRILLNFNHYYDANDCLNLAAEAKKEDCSLLMYEMPKLDEDQEFTPTQIWDTLKNSDRVSWIYSKLQEHWKEKYLAEATEPPQYNGGYLCPISISRFKGKFSARWVDCAYCKFNLAEPPGCRCIARAGIQSKDDFKRERKARIADIEKIRRSNEERLLEREARENERFTRRTNARFNNQPMQSHVTAAAGPSRTELDAEYNRICSNFDEASAEWTVDKFKRRWIKCMACGQIKQDNQMSSYGGRDGPNRGICSACSRAGRG